VSREVVGPDADDLGEALARAVDVGEHRQLRMLDVVEENRLAPAAMRRGRDGGEFVLRIDLARDFEQLAACPALPCTCASNGFLP